MWRKPPRQVEEAVRRMFGFAAVLGGFAFMGSASTGLPALQKVAFILLSFIGVFGSAALVLWNPKSRMESRYRRALAAQIPGKTRYLVEVTLLKGKNPYGSDSGVLTFEEGCLYFYGLTTGFSIPRSQIRPRVDPDYTRPAPGLTQVLTNVDGEAISIDVRDEGNKPDASTLARRFEHFWAAESSGTFIPPPTQRHLNQWSSRFFPGWKRLLFWCVIYLFVIVQSFVLGANGHRSTHSLFVWTFFGTLIIATGLDLINLVRFSRQPIEAITPPVLENTVHPAQIHGSQEARIHA